MFLNILALLSAVSISGVAAYYSIAGLTAIFSGAVIPIIIMGGVLEFGKIITTVWLHQNWNRVNVLVKWYLCVAVVVLMFVTSMGIFGFLSRAHIETTSSVGDNTLLIEQIDQNLGVEQQRIKDNQALIKQMDDAVNGLLNSSASNATKDNNRTATLTAQATKLRDSQKKERLAANQTIDETNKRIADLNSQKLKLNQAQLKVEAEVGPIKYIAQLIYGDNVDKSLLERAVRWVIIFIVAVFDPLAVSLVLGATMGISSRRKERDTQTEEIVKEVIVEKPVEKIVTVYNNDAIQRAEALQEELEELRNREPEIIERVITQAVPIYEERIIEKIVEVPTETIVEKIVEVEKIVDNTDNKTLIDLTVALDQLLKEVDSKNREIHQLKAERELYREEAAGIDARAYLLDVDTDMIGPSFPSNPYNGQLFILVSQPNNLYKWNGTEWISVDKQQNSSYTDNINWKHWQLGRMQRKEVEYEDMTPAEQSAIDSLGQ